MRKKLLMNNYSENGLLPVMDGLVCWLDGRDGKIGDTIWRDRSNNGNNGNLYNFGSNSFRDGYLVSENNRNYVELFKQLEMKNKTFILNSKMRGPSSSNNNNTILMGLWAYNEAKDSIAIINGYPSANITSLIYSINKSSPLIFSSFNINNIYSNIAIVITDNQIKTYLNNVLIQASSITHEFILETFYLLRKEDAVNKCCAAMIGSFMAYNRALTEEEIQHNYLYEQSIERG